MFECTPGTHRCSTALRTNGIPATAASSGCSVTYLRSARKELENYKLSFALVVFSFVDLKNRRSAGLRSRRL